MEGEGRLSASINCAKLVKCQPNVGNHHYRTVLPEVRATVKNSFARHGHTVVHLTQVLSSSAQKCWLSTATGKKYSRAPTVPVSEF
jgi:hypothetical protein